MDVSSLMTLYLYSCSQNPHSAVVPVTHPSFHPPCHSSPMPFSYLFLSCSPHPLDRLCHTNIVGLKLVQADANRNRRQVERPPEKLTQAGVFLLGDVVDDDGLEADVRVKEHSGAEDGIHGRVQGAGGEGSHGQRDEASGEKALKGPVVGAMSSIGLRNGSRVVDCRSS